ncbi:furostanol glycoside 26-O-beta-glucosidase-like isoform X2 [Syzygium oleosum]|uniref:furostanol glycoside 26-O-beta-glucosidase-like isoform X2 n=1 Tax=Syzygium oleosum TaxID=219896 RepID=UPI0011D1CB6C|nr:furostanol glycoside 26-O-beta-glucosidase-like isoform X2 [Syzygium oleosum]
MNFVLVHSPFNSSFSEKLDKKSFFLNRFIDPVVNGDYPSIMRSLVKDRLPTFTAEEKKLMKGSFDFIGINYYSSTYAQNVPEDERKVPTSYSTELSVKESTTKNSIPIGAKSEGIEWIYRYPDGLVQILDYIKRKYQNPKIYITEYGVTEAKVEGRPLANALNDPHRIDCLKQHLALLLIAMK